MHTWSLELISLIVAAISVTITFLIYMINRHKMAGYRKELKHIQRSVDINHDILSTTAFSRIINTAENINNKFIEWNIDLPVLKSIEVPDSEKEEVSKKTVLLLQQINLLYLTFLFIKTIGPQHVEAQKQWARSTVKPWMKDDPYLSHVVNSLKAGTDLYHRDFEFWLRDIFHDI